MRLVLASNNAKKLSEMKALLTARATDKTSENESENESLGRARGGTRLAELCEITRALVR